MRLHKKTLIIISATITCLMLILYASSHITVMRGFADLEKENVRWHMERVLAALDKEFAELVTMTGDWSIWDDAYEFIHGNPRGTFQLLNDADENYDFGHFTSNRSGMMVYLDSSAHIVFGKAFDLHAHKKLPLPEALNGPPDSKAIFTAHSDVDSVIKGILLHPENPMLIVSRPITNSNKTKPVKGTLILGRFLNTARIARISELAGIEIVVNRIGDNNIPDDVKSAWFRIKKNSFVFQTDDTNRIHGYIMIKDIYDKPAFVIHIIKHREIYARGLTCNRSLLAGLLVSSLILGFGIMLILENMILFRLAGINRSIRKISGENHLDVRLQVKGSDELANFANVFNDMLDTLEKSQKTLEIAKDAAEAANRSKSRFLANMSHEIRTPMNSILGFTELLAEIVTDKKQQEYLFYVQSAGKLLFVLIDDILDLSRIEAGKLNITHKIFEPRVLFKEMETIFFPAISEKSLNFIFEIDKELPDRIILDEVRLRQVLFNLIGNAVKFTDAGYVRISVKCRYDYENYNRIDLSFFVEDSGIGIPEDQQERIFDVFEQVKDVAHAGYGGTGLGLAITKRLVEGMGGTLNLTGKSDSGSRFTVNLPNVRAGEISNRDMSNEVTLALDSLVFEKASILIVDDVKSNRDLVRGMLEQYDFIFIEATNGRQGVEMAKAIKPDLILMDMKMPEMGGREATLKIKEDKNLANIPVIAFTAYSMKEAEEEIKGFCDGYLRKPINKKILVKKMMDFLPCALGRVEKSKQGGQNDKTVIKTEEESGNHENIFNRKAALRQMDGDEQLLEQYIKISMEDILEELKKLESALENHEKKLIKIHTHTIKGIAATMGADTLHEAALEMENAINHSDIKESGSFFEKIEQEYVRFRSVINKAGLK